MKRRIEQLLNGIFEYEAPRLVVSQEEIRAVLRKGRTFRGEFRVESADKRKVKGFIYADSPRMAYEPSDFLRKSCMNLILRVWRKEMCWKARLLFARI